jgi:ABC-type Fe3+-hydroxamate transport system substrate-binding protein
VSLVPSLTEALFAFGAGDRVVGCTRYCTEPSEGTAPLVKVGGTRRFSVSRVLELEPDLVLAVKEENDREQIEALRQAGIRVLVGEPASVASAISLLRLLGDTIGTSGAPGATPIIERIESSRAELRGAERRSVFVPVWKESSVSFMTLGGDTYAHDVLDVCGGDNVFGERLRYPAVSTDEIESAEPEVILLPDEPYEFSEEDRQEILRLDTPASREGNVYLVDGKALTWYGPRISESLARIESLIHR